MKVEMLDSRLYRGEHLDVGQVTDMDGRTGAWFVEQGWARVYDEPAPMTAAEADEALPKLPPRRRALR